MSRQLYVISMRFSQQRGGATSAELRLGSRRSVEWAVCMVPKGFSASEPRKLLPSVGCGAIDLSKWNGYFLFLEQRPVGRGREQSYGVSLAVNGRNGEVGSTDIADIDLMHRLWFDARETAFLERFSMLTGYLLCTWR
jgi:hypothetical protein